MIDEEQVKNIVKKVLKEEHLHDFIKIFEKEHNLFRGSHDKINLPENLEIPEKIITQIIHEGLPPGQLTGDFIQYDEGLGVWKSRAALTPGSVVFVDANAYFAQDNTNFFWDNTNNILKVSGLSIQNKKELRFYDNGNYVGFEAPALAANFIWKLPAVDGLGNDVLGTDAAGQLIWITGTSLGNVVAASNFGTDNVILRSDGTGKGVQHTGIVIDDNDHLYIPELIYHKGDLNTSIRFQTDQIALRAGGINFINMVEDATNYLQLLDGLNFIGDDVNTKMTRGLTINQGANDDEILDLKSSDVAHGMTDVTEADTYFYIKKWLPDGGAALVRGLGEGVQGIILSGYYVNDNTTKTPAGRAPVELYTAKRSGAGVGNVGANANIVAMRAYVGGGALTRWILGEDGDTWQDGNITMASATSTITGGTDLFLEATNNLRSLTTMNATVASAANMYIQTTGDARFYRSTSGAKYKDKIKDLELDSLLIYNLKPRSYNSKCIGDDKNKRFIGLVAEEIEQYYPEIIDYNDNHEAENYDSKMLMTLMLAEAQRHEARIKELEARLNN